ncbi:hypothetical protein J7337_013962 [Fusarium musae]|uniref:L-arabinitol 4-dehydrogenase n=1 Tax=Fusarium musae TaxID=1042133 RepID=A0A9P8D3U1_9HYPO|nr:hypothetical protein J7337_013962 [Fusarium musae]KAG9494823.1 hypothetical protein J7337_013962 [Fusarium musae]
MGTGPIGLLCGAVAKAFVARKIIGVDIVQSKLKFAEGLGFTHTYLSKRISAEDNAVAILDSGDLGQGADVVIDASGAETFIQTSLHVVKAGGVYVQGGMGKADITFPIMAMCQKEVTVKGSFRYGSGDFELAIELVSSNRVPAEEAFKKAKECQFVKVLIAGPNEPIQAKGLDSLSQESTHA